MDDNGQVLRILLLGPPLVTYGERPLRVQRRLMRSLLFYLAAQAEPVSRMALIDLFWPDEEFDQARRHLRETLSKLRAELPQPTILMAEQDYVWLDPIYTYSDVLEFQSLINQVRPYLQRQGNTPLPEAIYQQMYKAIHLWRSPEFLPGANMPSTEDLDRWLSQETQSLGYQRQSLLEALADHAAVSGDLEEAIYWVKRALETDEENPDLHYRHISWLRDLGRRAEAVEACDLSLQFFKDLGEVPSAIQRLCQQMHEQAGAPAPEAPAPWHNTLTLQLPFVGRKKILADLRLALQRGGVELIWGEAGAGKSRLTFEFYQSLEPAPRLLYAAAHSHLMTMPYQPLVDLIRHAVTIDEWQRLDAVWAGTLSALLPELPTLRPGSHRPKDVPAANQSQVIAEAFLQLFTLLARRQRLLFFLDDAQWSDAETFQVLAYLLNHKLFAEHGLLVIAARPEETNPGLTGFLSQSQVPWMVHHTTLELLNRDEVAELARLALGKPAHNQLVERLARDTGGNPLFLLETLRALLDFHIDPAQPQQFEHLPLASSIHALVRERLRLLDPQARHAVATAAVIGNTFNLELFQTTAQLTQAQTVTVLEELEHAHLVQPVQADGSAASYRFIHDKIREVLLFELSQARLQFLNLQVAKALEEMPGDSRLHAEAIARYYENAGELVQAFNFWLAAAEFARIRTSRLDASSAFQRAESLLLKVELSLPDTAIYRLYSEWAELSCEYLDSDQAELCYAAMLRYGEQRYTPLLVGAAYSGLARVAGMRRQPRLALAHLDHAAPFLRDSNNLYEQIEADSRRSEFLSQLLRYPEAVQVLRSILEHDLDLPDPRARQAISGGLARLALNYILLAQPEQARAAAEKSLEASRYFPRLGYRLRAQALKIAAEVMLDRYETALRECTQTIELAEMAPDLRLVCDLYTLRSSLYTFLGRLDRAWQDAERAMLLARDNRFDEMVARAWWLQGDIWLCLRDFPAAISAFRMGLDASNNHVSSMECLYRLGLALGHNRQFENGFSFLHQAIDLCRETNLDMVRLPAELAQATLLLQSGRVEQALVMAAQAAGEARGRGLESQSLTYPWLAGSAAAALDPGAALQHARLLIERGHEMCNPWIKLKGLELGLSLPATEDDQQAWQQELELLLADLETQARRPEFQPALQRLRENMDTLVPNR